MPDATDNTCEAKRAAFAVPGSPNPVVVAQLWEIAQDYLARAVKLRVDSGFAAEIARPFAPARPRGRGFDAVAPAPRAIAD